MNASELGRLEQLAQLIDTGKLRVPIQRSYPLEQTGNALTDLQSQYTEGKDGPGSEPQPGGDRSPSVARKCPGLVVASWRAARSALSAGLLPDALAHRRLAEPERRLRPPAAGGVVDNQGLRLPLAAPYRGAARPCHGSHQGVNFRTSDE